MNEFERLTAARDRFETLVHDAARAAYPAPTSPDADVLAERAAFSVACYESAGEHIRRVIRAAIEVQMIAATALLGKAGEI